MNGIPEILDGDLPLETALRAARERGQILQTDGKRCLLHEHLLPTFARLVGGGSKEPSNDN